MGHWLNLAARLANGQHVATESIRFQNRDKFEKVTAAVAEMRKTDYSRTAYETSTIPAVIKECFGITVRLCDASELGLADQRLAAVHPPELDKNHPLVPEFQRITYKGNNDLGIYSKFAKDGVIIGEVNDLEATVGGDYSKVICQLYVTPVLFADESFTDEELGAIILHEVGHIYTYFKLMYTSIENRRHIVQRFLRLVILRLREHGNVSIAYRTGLQGLKNRVIAQLCPFNTTLGIRLVVIAF